MVGNAAHENPLYHLAMLRPKGAGSAVDELRQKRMVKAYKPKIIQIIDGGSTEAWPLTLLGLGDDGVVYYCHQYESRWQVYQPLEFGKINNTHEWTYE